MTQNSPTHSLHARQRYVALNEAILSLQEKLLADPDKEGMHDAARQLGILEGEQIAIGEEDEAGALLDFYLCDVPWEGSTRIEAFVADPPAELTPDERAVLGGFAGSRFGIFEVRGDTPDGGLELRDVFTLDLVVFPDPSVLPTSARTEMMALRVFELEGMTLHTRHALTIAPTLRKFLRHPEAVRDLSALLDQGRRPGDDEPLTGAILLRALLAARAARAAAQEQGGELRMPKQKRSLARRRR